jgi:hypothetical protein
MCSGQKYLVQSPIIRSHPEHAPDFVFAISNRPTLPPDLISLGASPLCAGPLRLLIIEDCQVGFPIRTSRDQRVLSPPPGLSQSATSFIASCCQGIHQTPLSRLIRSRRRQALLCAAGSAATRRPSLVGSLRPRRIPSAGDAPVASPERSHRSDRTHGQCHLTWKDCSGCRPCRVPEPKPRSANTERPVATPTRAGPRTSRVLLSSRCQLPDVAIRQSVVSSSRSRDRTGRLIIG